MFTRSGARWPMWKTPRCGHPIAPSMGGHLASSKGIPCYACHKARKITPLFGEVLGITAWHKKKVNGFQKYCLNILETPIRCLVMMLFPVYGSFWWQFRPVRTFAVEICWKPSVVHVSKVKHPLNPWECRQLGYSLPSGYVKIAIENGHL